MVVMRDIQNVSSICWQGNDIIFGHSRNVCAYVLIMFQKIDKLTTNEMQTMIGFLNMRNIIKLAESLLKYVTFMENMQ